LKDCSRRGREIGNVADARRATRGRSRRRSWGSRFSAAWTRAGDGKQSETQEW